VSSLVESLISMLSKDTLSKVSKQLGLPKDKTKQILPDVLAVITSALASNTSNKKEAQLLSNALAKDHDGSILDNLNAYIGSYQSGEGNGILKHVLGDDRTSVESLLSQKTGLDINSIANLLTMAAPLIMGIIGKTKKQQNLGVDSITNLLKNEQEQAKVIAPNASDILSKKQKNYTSDKKQVYQKRKVEKKADIKDIYQVKIPQDVFDIAGARLQSNPGKYKSANFRCQFDISGNNGGQWYVLINDGKKVVSKGVIDNPISTVIIKEQDFIKLVLGKLNAPIALLTGNIKIVGDVNHVIKLAETLLS
jgi:putative sterol carrier protein